MTTTDSERAWMVAAWLAGQTQREIGNDLNVSNTVICLSIKQFCDDWSPEPYIWYEQGDRHHVALLALASWFMKHGEAPKRPLEWVKVPDYDQAMIEHVWLLRCEGLTYRAIGERVGGLSKERVRQKIHLFGRKVGAMMSRKRTHWRICTYDKPYQPPVERVHQDVAHGRLEGWKDWLTRAIGEELQAPHS